MGINQFKFDLLQVVSKYAAQSLLFPLLIWFVLSDTTLNQSKPTDQQIDDRIKTVLIFVTGKGGLSLPCNRFIRLHLKIAGELHYKFHEIVEIQGKVTMVA